MLDECWNSKFIITASGDITFVEKRTNGVVIKTIEPRSGDIILARN